MIIHMAAFNCASSSAPQPFFSPPLYLLSFLPPCQGEKMGETTKKEEQIKIPWTSSMGRLRLPGFFSIINLSDCSCLLIAASFL